MRLLLLVAVAAVLASSSEAKPRGLRPVRPQVPSGSHAVKWEGAVSPQELGQEKCVGCRPGTKRQNPRAGFVAESSSSVSPMIIGGGTATIKQLPWMALITMDDTYICGGSLISEMFILTSAQCVSGYNKFKVALGDVSRYYPSSSYRYVYTYKRIVHEDFEEDNYLNDIGLLQLLYPIQLSDAILPVKLPSSADVTTDFAGVKGTVSGYGYTSSNYEAYTLRYLEHVILKNERCVRFFPNYVTGKNICGDGEGGVGTCISDSGDPLVIQGDDGAWVQVGVSSFQSELGCSYGYPSVYTRVTEFLQWIQSKTDLKL